MPNLSNTEIKEIKNRAYEREETTKTRTSINNNTTNKQQYNTNKIQTNTFLDSLIGGLEKGIVTTLYGAPSTGKTNTCIAISAYLIKNTKVLFIDTEGGFSVERLKQISKDTSTFSNLIIMKPITFEEQRKVFNEIMELDLTPFSAIIIDGIANLYRYERDNKAIQLVNQQFASQLSDLVVIARKSNIPIVLTNQVYVDPTTGTYRMVGGDIVAYRSKTMIELIREGNKRIAIVRKHRAIKDGKAIHFEINDKGVIGLGNTFYIRE